MSDLARRERQDSIEEDKSRGKCVKKTLTPFNAIKKWERFVKLMSRYLLRYLAIIREVNLYTRES